ncbi:PigN-domain-containing protein [Basidiobolus meristosporus CBS 931.73]|uniref:GPI ethanolamine phosphate transferase 1 n=1 Tax=Basidiobolus meristosporus CBS 931.73 TaxID=1314790 RepID=A0A1Y1XJ88_9FUNG|nr:PigN-domain-containing protein [Basidiobolus meristosporus CBS 931.73]|eukprot:ORX85434.1 PigN-domain-containing protein [Basidiobolus meristosporus CBS 931.73]
MRVTGTGLLILGIIFHAIYLWSIFDIYFTSPLVHGMTPHQVDSAPPAERLVLFVADGLRADKLYQVNQREETYTFAPYLRSIIQNNGTWGVSHTRVPTESRPGHVAIIAGFYEDVSAVTKGWKMNPVNFDSVFNQSRHTWSYGSPDILPMFSHGASDPDRVETFMYAAEDEDFSQDATALDEWVFDHFTDLFTRAESDRDLKKKLHEDKIVFFLHLLGLDTNGHAYRPSSDEYLNNIRYVDDGIRKMVEMVENFYGHDGKTSYVLTADHGMGNRGSHGDGHPDNTRTPLIAWGAGVKKPNLESPTGHDDFSADWELSHVQRNDVKQADIAPLMASLVGLNYPVNSVGVLPLNYLENSPQFKAESSYVNAKQILEQYLVKNAMKEKTEFAFKPFSPLSNTTHHYSILDTRIHQLIREGNYEEAEALCSVLIDLSLEGLRYLQTYDWLFLRSIVTAGYIGWIFYSLIFILETFVVKPGSDQRSFSARGYQEARSSSNAKIQGVAVLGFLGLAYILFVQESPIMYYAYGVFPFFFWAEVVKKLGVLLGAFANAHMAWYTGFGILLAFVGTLELLAFSYFNRGVLSAFFVLGAVWPLFMPAKVRSEIRGTLFMWSIFCLCTAVFPSLPVEKGENIPVVLLGGFLVMISGVIAYIKAPHFMRPGDEKLGQTVIGSQVLMLALSMVLVHSTSGHLKAKNGLPLLNQLSSWLVLALSSSIPFFYGRKASHHYIHRLVVIYLAYAPVFVLLSISYEALFYFFFSNTLLMWITIEKRLYLNAGIHDNDVPSDDWSGELISYRSLQLGDVRIAAAFLFFINVAFFGTGNIASISSFSLESVYRLTTVFDPFLMGALLIFKILVPFLLVSSAFEILARSLDVLPFSLFLLAFSSTDVMTLNFFYLVRDDGSWLEIGTSISHFCIASCFVIFTIVLYGVSHFMDQGPEGKPKSQ